MIASARDAHAASVRIGAEPLERVELDEEAVRPCDVHGPAQMHLTGRRMFDTEARQPLIPGVEIFSAGDAEAEGRPVVRRPAEVLEASPVQPEVEQHVALVLQGNSCNGVFLLLDQYPGETEHALIPVAAGHTVAGGQADMVKPDEVRHNWNCNGAARRRVAAR
jgi:hypothetical protein